MNLALYYSIVLFFAFIVMITGFIYVIYKKYKEYKLHKLSKDIIFYFKEKNNSQTLSDMINFHKNINK